MKNTKMAVMVVGMVVGADLMALAAILIFGMGTGAGGAALILATIAVAGGSGFLMGVLSQG